MSINDIKDMSKFVGMMAIGLLALWAAAWSSAFLEFLIWGIK